jgi:hypothetical protein
MILIVGKTHGGSYLCRSNFTDDCHELVPGLHDARLSFPNTVGYGYICRFVSDERLHFNVESKHIFSRILLDNSSPSWSSQLEDQPAHRLNTTESCSGWSTTSTYSSFRTVTKIVASKEYLRLQATTLQSTFQSYPFDMCAFNDRSPWYKAYYLLHSYLAPFLFYTRNINTGEIAALKVSDSFGVAVCVCHSRKILSYLNKKKQELQNLPSDRHFELQRLQG